MMQHMSECYVQQISDKRYVLDLRLRPVSLSDFFQAQVEFVHRATCHREAFCDSVRSYTCNRFDRGSAPAQTERLRPSA